MSDDEFFEKIEALIDDAEEMYTANEWGDFTVKLFQAVEKAASYQGKWAEFDSALRVLNKSLEQRIQSGRWPG